MALFKVMRGALGLGAVLATLAAPAWAYPHWSSDQFRAARPVAPADALIFDLETTVTGAGKPAVVTRSTVTLAATFTDLASDGSHQVDDHSLCRTLTWAAGDRVFENVSCYASPAFRLYELQNRKVMNALVGKLKGSAPTNLYWDEVELGVQAPESTRPSASKTGAQAEYRLEGKVVAKVSGLAGPASPEEMRRLARFLARNAMLHPAIRRDVAVGAGPPLVIENEAVSLGATEQRTMRLTNLRRAQVAYPLPPGLGSAVRAKAATGTSLEDAAVRQAMLVIDDAHPRRKPTLRNLVDGMGTAKTPMESVLLFYNATQQYGAALTRDPNRQGLLAEIGPALRSALLDPDARQFYQANNLAGDAKTAGDREASARWLASMGRLDALPFGTFRSVTYANLVQTSKETDKWGAAARAGMPERLADNYWIHIAAYPWAANAYKDAGDTLMTGYDTPRAWLAFDLGRAVDPDWRMGVMANVPALENQVRTAAPDFF